MVGFCIDKPTFYSSLLLTVVCAMMILMYEHTQNRHIRGNEGWGERGN